MNGGKKHRSVFLMRRAYKDDKKTFGGIDKIIAQIPNFCYRCVKNIKLAPQPSKGKYSELMPRKSFVTDTTVLLGSEYGVLKDTILLNIVDKFSKFAWSYWVSGKTALETVRALTH